MTEFLERFAAEKASRSSTGTVQKTALISVELNERLQAMAATLKTTEAELLRAMTESGLIDLEAYVESHGITVPGRRKK